MPARAPFVRVGPVWSRATPWLVSCSAVIVLKSLLISHKGSRPFRVVAGPTNYIVDLANCNWRWVTNRNSYIACFCGLPMLYYFVTPSPRHLSIYTSCQQNYIIFLGLPCKPVFNSWIPPPPHFPVPSCHLIQWGSRMGKEYKLD